MSTFKPLEIAILSDGEVSSTLAQDAAEFFADNSRIGVKPRPGGFVLQTVSEQEADAAIQAFIATHDQPLKILAPQPLYRWEDPILEPIMTFRIRTTAEFTDPIVNDIDSRRGAIQSVDKDGGEETLIQGLIPLANSYGWTNNLKQLTKDHFTLEIDFHGYEPIPQPEDPDPNEPAAGALRA
ncbi:MAG: hypothetical protein OEU46_21945 [Alphaproteobacteria bacterium]|nr:hypothetical protein [Alphaproteobacteria bacterium]